MIQPRWITSAGSLGTWAEGIFYQVPLQAVAGDENVFYRLIAGQLPAGVQITIGGSVEGTPKNLITVQGVTREVSEDITSRFTIRAFTRLTNGAVARFNDRTFEITVSGQDAPEWITPSGRIATFYDGTEGSINLQYFDQDPDERLIVTLISGQLPPDMILDPDTGRISGLVLPLTGPSPGQAPVSRGFQFTLSLSDGKESVARNFEIYVYAKNTMTADNTVDTADNDFITADVTPQRPPVLITPEGSLGIVRADNFFAFRFEAIDFEGDDIDYLLITGPNPPFGTFGIPPGLSLNIDTGWLYGYIPDQGATESVYQWGIRVRKKIQLDPPWQQNVLYLQGAMVSFGVDNYVALQNILPGISPRNDFYWEKQETDISRLYVFSIDLKGPLETDILWLVPQDLGIIDNGAISTLTISATNVGGKPLGYRIPPGSNSKLPQGLTLQPSGNITGRVSFNTFALDGGTTTFDSIRRKRIRLDETTFDLEFKFTVNAFSTLTEQLGFGVSRVSVISGGSGYVLPPLVIIEPPPDVENAIQATATVTDRSEDGRIILITVDNPGRGYTSPPRIFIEGGGGSGAEAIAEMTISNRFNSVSAFRRFSIRINRSFDQPYENLYIQCMPPENDRALIQQLVQNQTIIPQNLVYRADDPNFGVSNRVIYVHAYGLTAATLPQYVASLDLNHYWRDIILGPVRTAQAQDDDGKVIYEVVYSEIIDNLVNNQGQSVGKIVDLAYGIQNPDDSSEITQVYPNSLVNMRDQVIDVVGRVSPALPAWMTSKQQDGRVLGFTPAWVIAYVRPGEADRVAYNINNQFGNDLNLIDFEIDRYSLDRSQTHNWDPETQQWIPQPPAATVFDQPGIPPGGPPLTVFDGKSTEFITPADRWIATDEFNRYLLYPKRNILR